MGKGVGVSIGREGMRREEERAEVVGHSVHHANGGGRRDTMTYCVVFLSCSPHFVGSGKVKDCVWCRYTAYLDAHTVR